MAKILLSAFSCTPYRGSEPGVGWHWAVELARFGHEVWVLTWPEDPVAVETEMRENPLPNLKILFYQLPKWLTWWQKGLRGIRLYYLLWQLGAYRFAKRIHQQEHFDCVHHITFGVIRHPSFMGNLGIPFIFGPVGGGERTPWRLRKSYGMRCWIWDFIRDGANLWAKVDPLMFRTFQQADKIYIKTPHSRWIVPKRFWSKTEVQSEIGIDLTKIAQLSEFDNGSEQFQILYVGRCLDWKGMPLGLQAFARFLNVLPQATLTIVAEGRDEKHWRQLIHYLDIEKQIRWIGWIEQQQLFSLYTSHDVLLFPSLHDSSGNVVLEALAHGLPVVCLDLGGPGTIVNGSYGRVIPTRMSDEETIIEKLSDALLELVSDRILQQRLRCGAVENARLHTWTRSVRNVYDCVAPMPRSKAVLQ